MKDMGCDMERLTARSFDGTAHATRVSYCDIIDKLAEYEDLEEQGLLLRLPCKVGDTVYTVSSFQDCCEDKCMHIFRDSCYGCEKLRREYVVRESNFQIQMIATIGKSVFLTKEEAEQALERMKEV